MKLKLALLAGAAPAAALYGAPRPVQIIPSVLPADFAALGLDCTALEKAGCDRIQFDVMDGNFVPNLTFGPDVTAAHSKMTSEGWPTPVQLEPIRAGYEDENKTLAVMRRQDAGGKTRRWVFDRCSTDVRF